MSRRRVVVSVGTDHHPFERALDWIVEAQQALDLDVFVQRGATPERPGLTSDDFLAQDELDATFDSADVVVCHGGPGTIAAARRHGHVPIVIPRDPRHGEHVDDHQMRYSERLLTDGLIVVATSSDDLIRLIAEPHERLPDGEGMADRDEAVEKFAALVDQLVADRLPKRRWRDRFQLRRTP